MTAVLILSWTTIAALVLIARLDYRASPRLITDPLPPADTPTRVRAQRMPAPHAVFRAPPLPDAACVGAK